MPPKSIAELRTSTETSLPERTYPLCVAQGLVARAQALAEEKQTLTVEARRTSRDDESSSAPIRKMAEGADPRLAEVDAELEQVWDSMREHTGEVLLRGETGGQWRRWVNAHPAAEESRDNETHPDQSVAYGFCDAEALLSRLGDFVVAWNGEPLGGGEWDWLVEHAPPGDLKEMARLVVQMHEGAGVRAPKSPSDSSATPQSETSSA